MDDPFGALDDSAFDYAPVKSRHDRMRAAFEESTRSYNPTTELIVVDEGWYSSPATFPGLMAAKAALKTIDYEISRRYAQRSYARVLDLILSELSKPETVDSKEYHRSLLDTALRCYLKLGVDDDAALQLVEQSKDKWAGAPVLALTSSEILLSAGRARDAISAVLSALEYNASLNPCLAVLLRSLQGLSSESEAANRLADQLRSKMSKQRQRSDFPFLTQRRSQPGDGITLVPADDDTIALWCQSCGLDNDSAARLQKLLLASKPGDDEGAEVSRRSVKEL